MIRLIGAYAILFGVLSIHLTRWGVGGGFTAPNPTA